MHHFQSNSYTLGVLGISRSFLLKARVELAERKVGINDTGLEKLCVVVYSVCRNSFSLLVCNCQKDYDLMNNCMPLSIWWLHCQGNCELTLRSLQFVLSVNGGSVGNMEKLKDMMTNVNKRCYICSVLYFYRTDYTLLSPEDDQSIHVLIETSSWNQWFFSEPTPQPPTH